MVQMGSAIGMNSFGLTIIFAYKHSHGVMKKLGTGV